MPGLDPGIHAVTVPQIERRVEWIAGSSPAMTSDVVDQTPITLRPVSFAELPGWSEDDHAAALAALLNSCRKMPSPDEACAAALALGDGIGREAARAFFEANYTPHSCRRRRHGRLRHSLL